MAQGNQSRGLIQMSKAQGWDPTRVFDPATGKYVESIEHLQESNIPGSFDSSLKPMASPIPKSMPDGYDVPMELSAENTTFAVPAHRSETINAPFPKSKGDPFPDMGI